MKHIKLIVVASAASLALGSGCSDITGTADADEELEIGTLSYWSESDDFAGAIKSYVDGSFWIDSQRGQYLEVQFQCVRSRDNRFPNEFRLIATSLVDASRNEYARPRFFDVLLYKINDNSASIYTRQGTGDILYRTGQFSDRVGPFTQASFDLAELMSRLAVKEVSRMDFRFVYGAPRDTSDIGSVQDLSGYPAIDVSIDATDPEIGRILGECANEQSQS